MWRGTSRLERVLWASALAVSAVAVGVLAWRRDPAFRSSVDRLLGSRAGVCGPAGPVPGQGPVRLPTCRQAAGEPDPWLPAGAHGPDLGALAGLSEDLDRLRWDWVDVNTVPVLRWEGDVRVVDPSVPGRALSVSAVVDLARARAMERAFGYDVDRAVIRYRDDAELAAKRASLDGVLARHGVQRKRGKDGDVLSPDYEWMIEASLDDVRPVAEAIRAEARRRGARGLRAEFGAFASFVQQLRYGLAPDPGDGKHRFGLSMPLWALATGTGDCDTRAVLLAALARSIRLCDVHLVRDADHQHMLAAADVPVSAGDRIVRPGGRALVLVETTDEWPVGRVAGHTRGEGLQTLFLASSQADPVSAAAASTPRRSPQPISMRAQRQAPEPRTSAASRPPR